MSKLRILLLITNLGAGGAQKVFSDHSDSLSQMYEVEEAVFDLANESRFFHTDVKIHSLQRRGFLNNLGSIGRLFSRAFALRHLVIHRKFDLVISHMDGANWVNVLSFSPAKKILVVHGTVLGDENVPPSVQFARRRFIFPFLYNFADCTVSVSGYLGRELSEIFGVRNVRFIPNYFDTESIRKKAKESLPSEYMSLFNKPLLVTSGRLSEQKKQTHLLDILKELRRRGIQARLLILGDGSLRDKLVLKSRLLGLKTVAAWETSELSLDEFDVCFLGHVVNPYQFLSRSDLFLFPSGWEGFPLALCEAMICGVPVLSSDCRTGPREILSDRSNFDGYKLRSAEFSDRGVLLPIINSDYDLGLWAETVRRLLDDQSARKQMAANASIKMLSLDKRTVFPEWIDLITELMNDKRSSGS